MGCTILILCKIKGRKSQKKKKKGTRKKKIVRYGKRKAEK